MARCVLWLRHFHVKLADTAFSFSSRSEHIFLKVDVHTKRNGGTELELLLGQMQRVQDSLSSLARPCHEPC